MRNLILTLAATATLLVGSLMVPDTADARPRWRGRYYRAPAVRYYAPYYGGYYGPRYYGGYYYPRYYSYPYRYSWGGPWYGGSGFYFRF
jgi:hypothetical protein